jgi:hypothetical protein
MKQFLIQAIGFFTLLVVSMLVLMLQADGYTDAFYLRFTTPQQQNLILGTSKAAQGLQPQVIQPIISTSIYNYAFDIGKSPYGPKYLESIKRKLDPKTKHGIFILTVDGWSISARNANPNDSLAFDENHSCVGTQYLSGRYNGLIFKSSIAFLHDDGWLEVTLNNDSASVNRRTKSTLDQYKQYESAYHFSELRLAYLIKTIEFLNQYGKVYLVRLPVASELMEIEQRLLPDFNQLIKKPAATSSGYLDLTSENNYYQYTDGVHLSRKSGQVVSEKIARWIKSRNSE